MRYCMPDPDTLRPDHPGRFGYQEFPYCCYRDLAAVAIQQRRFRR